MALLCLPSAAEAQSGENPDRILKAMYDYIASQKNISMTFDTRSRWSRQSSSCSSPAPARCCSAGRTRFARHARAAMPTSSWCSTVRPSPSPARTSTCFARGAPGTIDQLVGQLRDDGLDLPGADFCLARGYEDMTGCHDFQHIGRGVIDGVECEHLAFRGDDVDWQIWIESERVHPTQIRHHQQSR